MPTSTDGSDYVQISARIPANWAAELERAARQEDRTLSAELRRAIRQYLAPSITEATA